MRISEIVKDLVENRQK